VPQILEYLDPEDASLGTQYRLIPRTSLRP
jgi:hypothetical protein